MKKYKGFSVHINHLNISMTISEMIHSTAKVIGTSEIMIVEADLIFRPESIMSSYFF